MEENNTFKNLQLLEATRTAVQNELGLDYENKVIPFVNIIQIVMKANDIDHFSAMSKIKNEVALYKEKKATLLFSAALMELVENKYFNGFEKS